MTSKTNLKTPLLPPQAPPPPQPNPLLLTIRFSASLPDLELDIPRPGATTVVSLKHLIRSRLEKSNARRRLRFIHGGKILPDTAVLSSVLRAPPLPPPPPSPSTYNETPKTRRSKDGGQTHPEDEDDPKPSDKSKGKQIPGRAPAPRIYINCSIGDELLPKDLEAEAKAASLPPPTPSTTQRPDLTLSTTNPATTTPTTTTTSTTPAPLGFDRLLQAGLTPSEVNQLRLQFRSIHASRYTPDTLPSPDTFRRMEDSWIDDNNDGSSLVPANNNNTSVPNPDASNDAAAMGGGTDSDEVGLVAMVDVLIRGFVIGFIWPLGSAGWLMREEGMSSDRWRFMVGVGVMFSILMGCIRAISGDNK